MATSNFDVIEINSPLEEISKTNSITVTTEAPKFSDSVQITIKDFEKLTTNKAFPIQDNSIVAYMIETFVTHPGYKIIPKQTQVWRTDEEFENFRNYLELTYPYILIPPLPEKKINFLVKKIVSDQFDFNILSKRKEGLEAFLNRIKGHQKLSEEEQFWKFLSENDPWASPQRSFSNVVKKAEKALIGWSIKHTTNSKTYTREFVDLYNYGLSFTKIMNNLNTISEKIDTKEADIMDNYTHMSETLKAMSLCIGALEEWFQKAANFMESLQYTSEDEDFENQAHLRVLFTDYQLYGDSIRAVCKNQELIQASVDKAVENLYERFRERESLSSRSLVLPTNWEAILGACAPKFLRGLAESSTLLTKLPFLKNDESKEAKQKKLDEEIKASEMVVKVIKQENETFISLAQDDIGKFKASKDTDFMQALKRDMEYQIQKNLRNASMWNSIANCFEAF